MANSLEFIRNLLDLFADRDAIRARRMFGGHGVFRDGLMFGLVADDVFYLKADDENRAEFEQRGLQSFRYLKQGKWQQIAYYQAPEEVFEDIDILSAWSDSAYAAALRARKHR